jgi:hypothetical protein
MPNENRTYCRLPVLALSTVSNSNVANMRKSEHLFRIYRPNTGLQQRHETSESLRKKYERVNARSSHCRWHSTLSVVEDVTTTSTILLGRSIPKGGYIMYSFDEVGATDTMNSSRRNHALSLDTVVVHRHPPIFRKHVKSAYVRVDSSFYPVAFLPYGLPWNAYCPKVKFKWFASRRRPIIIIINQLHWK